MKNLALRAVALLDERRSHVNESAADQRLTRQKRFFISLSGRLGLLL
jgi:hypothetical protein